MRRIFRYSSVMMLGFAACAWLVGAVAPSAAAQVTPTYPRVIASVKLTDLTSTVPTTTIFTPKKDGLYRISVYMTVTVAVPGPGGNWAFNLSWTDDAGAEGPTIIDEITDAPNPNSNNVYPIEQSAPFIFRADAGQPVSYEIGGPDDGATYEVFFTVEQLQ